MFEAGKTALSAFGLIGERLRGQQPLVVIVVVINNVEPQILGKSSAFVFANLVFALRINIWIAVEYGWPYAVSD